MLVLRRFLDRRLIWFQRFLNAPVSLYGGGPFQYELLLGDNDKKQVSLTDFKEVGDAFGHGRVWANKSLLEKSSSLCHGS